MKQKTKPPETLSDIECLLYDVSLLWRKALHHKTKQLQITSNERRVLFIIKRHPGLTQVQVARYLELEPQNLMRILDKFEKNNWIKKISDQQDRRAKLLYITESANAIIDRVMKIGGKMKPEILSGINQNELKILQKILHKTKANLLVHLSSLELQ